MGVILKCQDETTRQIAEQFIAYFAREIDLPTLKNRLALYEEKEFDKKYMKCHNMK